jgi:hypothetical protein
MDEAAYAKALDALRIAMADYRPGRLEYDRTNEARRDVIGRYQPVFSLAHIPNLTRDEFVSFLYFENNRHWKALYRKGLAPTENMPALRQALQILLDESLPVEDRLPRALHLAPGLGRGIATAILTVAYPDQYGVWNNTSENTMRELEIWPEANLGEDTGARYAAMNQVLSRLRADLATDFWTLDVLWSSLPSRDESAAHARAPRGATFRFEDHLEDFILDNWRSTPLGADWEIDSGDAEPNQFPTAVGRIDILARHKREPRFLVIELKRGQSSDQTIGQLLRYVGWAQKHLATNGHSVEGLIIAHQADHKLAYALHAVAPLDNIGMMAYRIDFRMSEVKP